MYSCVPDSRHHRLPAQHHRPEVTPDIQALSAAQSGSNYPGSAQPPTLLIVKCRLRPRRPQLRLHFPVPPRYRCGTVCPTATKVAQTVLPASKSGFFIAGLPPDNLSCSCQINLSSRRMPIRWRISPPLNDSPDAVRPKHKSRSQYSSHLFPRSSCPSSTFTLSKKMVS